MDLRCIWAWKGSWIIACLAVLWGYARYFEWRHFFAPRREIAMTPADAGMEYEEARFVAEDGCLLNGWWLPCPGARGSLIYCHGNASNLGDLPGVLAELRRLRVNIFAFDYRGYGKSKGIPTEKGVYRDARAAYEVVRARHGDAENPPVIVYGHSLGGAIATQLALDKPVRGLIVEGAFSSAIDIGQQYYPHIPLKWALSYRFDSASKAGSIRAPKLFAHSPHDDIVPDAIGRKLFEAAAPPKTWVDLPGGHNESEWSSSEKTWQCLEAFVEDALGPAPEKKL